MSPGRGIVHAEMPASRDQPAIGLQLWVNLPQRLKMIEPKYQEIPAKGLPRNQEGNIEVIVIAGEALGKKADVFTNVDMSYAHFIFHGAAEFTHSIPKAHNAFIYMIDIDQDVEVEIAGDKVESHSVILFDQEGDGIHVKSTGKMEFVVLSGMPIGEPVEQYGPFVMNTREELQSTMMDFQVGKNGFENARKWQSTIADLAL